MATVLMAGLAFADPILLNPSVGTITYKDQVDTMTAGGDNGCVLDLTRIDLLSISGTGASGVPGWNLRDRQLGVNGLSSGSPCTQVRVTQGIRFGLGSYFDTSRWRINTATLSLRALPKATIEVRTFVNTATGPVLVHELSSARRNALVCNQQCTLALNGSNDLDRSTTAAKQWDYVVVSSITGNTSSESGAFAVLDSQFDVSFVPEGSLVCDPRTGTTTVVDYAVDGATAGNKVTLTRLADAGSTSLACTALPYRLDFNGQDSQFLADYSVLAPGVEPVFEWRVEWDPIPVAVPADASLESPLTVETFQESVPLSVQQFLATDPEYVVDACVGTPVWDTRGTADISDDRVLALDLVTGVDYDMSAYPGTQYGCYLKRSLQLENSAPASCPDGSGYPAGTLCVPVQVNESGVVRGDWTLSKTTLR